MRFFTTIFFSMLFLSLGLLIGSSYYYISPLFSKITKATAVIHPTKGNRTKGIVHFTQEPSGVRITAEIENMAPGEHGFHIHEFGDCGCDGAVCAGAHFNPTKMPHAGPENPKRHVGDLGNIIANQSGSGSYSFLDSHLALNGPYSIIGRTVIIHEKKDDLTSQPTGDAGARIGCGVIGLMKSDNS